jgi:hypothetical protein
VRRFNMDNGSFCERIDMPFWLIVEDVNAVLFTIMLLLSYSALSISSYTNFHKREVPRPPTCHSYTINPLSG